MLRTIKSQKDRVHLMDETNEQEQDVVEASVVEVAGIIKDDQGHEWAIPADNVDDLDDLGSPGLFGHMKFDPRFHYQTEHQDKVSSKMTEGFVPVTRKEVGLPDLITMDYGKPVTDIVHLMDTVLLKIPKVLADRKQARKLRTAQEVVSATEPTEEMLSRAKRGGAHKFKRTGDVLNDLESDGAAIKQERVSRKSAYLTR